MKAKFHGKVGDRNILNISNMSTMEGLRDKRKTNSQTQGIKKKARKTRMVNYKRDSRGCLPG